VIVFFSTVDHPVGKWWQPLRGRLWWGLADGNPVGLSCCARRRGHVGVNGDRHSNKLHRRFVTRAVDATAKISITGSACIRMSRFSPLIPLWGSQKRSAGQREQHKDTPVFRARSRSVTCWG